MAVILDVENFSGRTYQARLQEALFSALAERLPQQQFWVPSGSNLDSARAFPNIAGADFPSQKGFSARKRTRKWLEQSNAKAFISFSRVLRTTVPLRQILIMDAGSVNEKDLVHAHGIGFVSDREKATLTEKYPSLKNRAFLAEGFWKPSPPGKQSHLSAGSELTDGREYFICTDLQLDVNQFINLLKGFSAFKKMLQSSWKLMVVLRSSEAVGWQEAQNLLASYKFRNDIVLTNEDHLPEKLKGSYCLVSLNTRERFPLEIAEAACTQTPVITPATHTLTAIYPGKGIVWLPDAGSESLGEKLIQLYKSETLRMQMAADTQIKGAFNKPRGMDAFIAVLQQELLTFAL